MNVDDLLSRAAAAIQDEAHTEAELRWRPAVGLAAADLLRAADEARPIDFAESPRSPADRRVIYAALTFAQKYLGEEVS